MKMLVKLSFKEDELNVLLTMINIKIIFSNDAKNITYGEFHTCI